MHAGRSGACAHISVSSKRGQGDSPCTRPCLQGVVCYTQTDTERKSKENSLPVDDCLHEDFRGCWGDMRAPVFGALYNDTTELRWKIARRLLRAIFHKERPSVSVAVYRTEYCRKMSTV